MARIPMVTRTIQTTQVSALCVNIAEQKPVEKTFTLSGTYKSEKQLLKALESVVNDDNIKVVHVNSTEVQQTLYGMSEQDFISNAKVLPKRETK